MARTKCFTTHLINQSLLPEEALCTFIYSFLCYISTYLVLNHLETTIVREEGVHSRTITTTTTTMVYKKCEIKLLFLLIIDRPFFFVESLYLKSLIKLSRSNPKLLCEISSGIFSEKRHQATMHSAWAKIRKNAIGSRTDKHAQTTACLKGKCPQNIEKTKTV